MKFPYTNAANKYARDIVAGRIPACRYVKLTCLRHLNDLKESKKKDYPYFFDKAEVENVCGFIELLPHTKGKWARERKKLILESWQKFIYACIFGWKRKSDKLRRFREAYNEIPRKNGKSVIASGGGNFMFCADGEFGAEVYSGATTEKQAWEVFKPAKLMCSRTPDLLEAFGVQVNAGSLVRLEDESKFEPLIGSPGDGQSPSCAIIDEYHEHDSNDLYETMISGMGARDEPLVFAITTAGDDISGPCYDKRRAVIEMLEGVTPDDELFGIIYTIDEDDDWTDPAVLIKANPNYDISVRGDYLRSQQLRAIKNPRLAALFKTKHLNVWVASRDAFFNMQEWQDCCDEELTLEQFQGESCLFALDLARKLDLNSGIRLFHREIEGKKHYYCISPYFWCPEDTIFETDNKKVADRYQKWVSSGHLIPTNGAEIDYLEILECAKDVNLNNAIDECPIDPHGATNLSHRLDDEGLMPVTIIQNYQNMSDPMKELEAAIKTGRFHHDGNPILTWCVQNVVGKYLPGNDDVVRPIKQVNELKIDGAVATIMAIGRAMAAETTSDPYKDRGIRTL